MPDPKSAHSGITTHSIEKRKLIGQAIIDGVLNPSHAALFGPSADYSQNGGNYTQKGGDYRQNGGGNYNQSKEMLPSLAGISELINKTQFGR
ncbi:MAG: hypothetical protein ACKOQM_02585 [Novosphingobium sp.]